jgi:type I restriction enzyme S subunit
MPVPPPDEQLRIVDAIDGDGQRASHSTDRLHRELDLLREYRIRLIADVITGKLDVRGAAARLPDEADEPEPPDRLDLEEAEPEPDDLEPVEA